MESSKQKGACRKLEIEVDYIIPEGVELISSQTKIVGTLFFSSRAPLVLSKWFIAVRSPNLVDQH